MQVRAPVTRLPQQWTQARGCVQLTAGPGDSTGPVWSKRGNEIAFERLAGSHANIAVVGADGKGERILTSGEGKNGGPVWRP